MAASHNKNSPIAYRLTEEDLSQNPTDVLDLQICLGHGSYGTVYKAQHRISNHVLAVKKVQVDTELEKVVKELHIMQQCNSEYIVKYFGSYFHDQSLWIVMEYCSAGSVADLIRLRETPLNELQTATVLRDALKGLNYLHRLCKIHRDIKAGNVLLTEHGHAKLADLGVAGQLTDSLAKRNTMIGTPFWMAPELIQEVGHGTPADIWSLGITALEMVEGRPPLFQYHPMRALFMIPDREAPTFAEPDKWSQEFHAFLQNCLVKNPAYRFNSEKLLSTKFIVDAPQPDSLEPLIKDAENLRKIKREIEEKNRLANKNRPSSISSTKSEESESESGTMIRKDTANRETESSNVVEDEYDDQPSMIINKTTTTASNGSQDSSLVTMVINNTIEEEGGGTLTQKDSVDHAGARIPGSAMENESDAQNNLAGAEGGAGAVPAVQKKKEKKKPVIPEFLKRIGGENVEDENNAKNGGGAAFNRNAMPGINDESCDKLYMNLSAKTVEDLEILLQRLDGDYEKEIAKIEAKYSHKRQPIADAYEAKLYQLY